jgi:flagellin-like hook-associated protein FlgL
MGISSITTSRGYLTQQLNNLSSTLSEKTSQLATSKVSTTYGGLGNQRLLSMELKQKVERIESYEETITMSTLHIKTLNLNLERMEALRIESKSTMDLNNFQLQADGQTSTQATAEILLTEAIGLLNAEVGGHYLFGGSDANTNPVLEMSQILDGVDGKAGLKQVMSEYWQANMGPAGSEGRLTVSPLNTVLSAGVPVSSDFTIAEDGAHDFGFDIAAVSSTLTNMNLTAPTGADPDSFGIEFTGQPQPGEKLTVELGLPPDGSETVKIELTATVGSAAEGEFVIGADLAETATNLRAALQTAIQEQAGTTLRAASDEWAANEFFDTYNGAVPNRVDGPPYDTATGVVSGAATTTAWYVGENLPTTDPRQDKVAAVDDNLSLGYGVRANEQGLTDVVKTLATFIAADFSGNTETDRKYYSSLADGLKSVLQPPNTDRSGIVDITTEIAVAYKSIEFTADRHEIRKSGYNTTIDEIEGVDKELLAAEILQMQTNIEAAYRASSIVMQLSLADYI